MLKTGEGSFESCMTGDRLVSGREDAHHNRGRGWSGVEEGGKVGMREDGRWMIRVIGGWMNGDYRRDKW
jgi:hypothetical protein